MKAFISNLLPERDKLMHMILCSYIYLFTAAFVQSWIALCVSLAIAILIEIIDKVSGEGTPETKDFFWGAIGALIPFLINLI